MNTRVIRIAGVVTGVSASLLVASACNATGTPALTRESERTLSFQQAKRILPAIHAGHEFTFYCDCAYDEAGIDRSSCGYVPFRENTRARRVEWEHVVPASWLGQGRRCWSKPPECVRPNGKHRNGRNCCARTDPEFAAAEGDLRNLVPAIGELNGRRSNYAFGDVPGEIRDFGACDFEISRDAPRVVEPRPEIRGDIARIHRYMSERHGLTLEPAYEELLANWATLDPIDEAERERERRIQAALRAIR